MSEHDELKDLLRPLVEASPPGAGEHLTPERLVAYHCGRSAPEQERIIQEHLVTCRDCTRMLLDLAALPAADTEEATNVFDAELSSRYALFQERLQSDAASAKPAVVTSSNRRARYAPALVPIYIPYALAASLLVAAVALAVWVASQRDDDRPLATRTREEESRAARQNEPPAAREQTDDEIQPPPADAPREIAEQPEESAREESVRGESARGKSVLPNRGRRTQIAEARRTPPTRIPPAVAPPDEIALNTPVFDLYPEETLRGGAEEIRTIEVPRTARSVTFTLNSLRRGAGGARRVQVIDVADKIVWSRGGLRRNAAGGFAVQLPRPLLPAGQYRLRLYGADGEPPEEYSVLVVSR